MFVHADGFPYTRFFRRMHRAHIFDCYLEIGCRRGTILSMVQGKTIGVDPYFRLTTDILGRKPQLLLYQEESDAFFANNRLTDVGAELSVAFIDGMHLFEFALRDIINTERFMVADGVIFVHDCFPRNLKMTTRDLSSLPNVWTGDVWKLVPILQEFRPDLELKALDAAPTGLLAISGLKPDQKLLERGAQLDEIVERYRDMSLEDFGVQRFFELLTYSDALKEVRQGFPLVSHLNRPDLVQKAPVVVTP